MHYFRVHPDQWRERLATLAAMGADSVETYVAWNVHEPRRGSFDFTGIADLGRFLDTAAEVGLNAIVRPGPYICAEWDNGGLPSWLTGIPGIHARTSDPVYVAEVDRWFDELIPVIAARQTTRGGNVTMVQVENEYGSFGSDKPYLEHVRDGLIARGIDVELFTSDGAEDHMLTGGMIPGVRATANFGSRPGHSFGAGANHDGVYQPTVTSYDYDAPLDERGQPTPKYWAFREVIARYRDLPAAVEPAPAPLLPAGSFALTEAVPLTALLAGRIAGAGSNPDTEGARGAGSSRPSEAGMVSLPGHDGVASSGHPPTFEELGLGHGLVRYSTTIPGPRQAYPLTLPVLRDRAHVYADGELIGIAERDADFAVDLAVPAEGLRLDVLVESMGRVNYGPHVGESKGLVGGVCHERQYLHTWDVAALELPDLPEVDWSAAVEPTPETLQAGAHLLRGQLEVSEPADAYLLPEGFGKGYLWVNGFCLGRYWARGPQRALYLPAPVLRAGANEVLVLELEEMTAPEVHVVSEPFLG